MRNLIDQFEFEERSLTPAECQSFGVEEGTREVIALRCRYCGQAVVSTEEMRAQTEFLNRLRHSKTGFTVFGINLISGLLHWLCCPGAKAN